MDRADTPPVLTGVEVFGRHAADSCLRRAGSAIRRCLRRASDVVGRIDGARFVVLSHSSDQDGVTDGPTARTLACPSGVLIDGPTLYVVDGENSRLLIYTSP